MRCPFCHNYELIHNPTEQYSVEEIESFLKKRKNRLEAVVVSGGEPCIHNDLPEFLSNIKSLGYFIKLDTNGCYPEMLNQLIKEALIDYVAMDIKAPLLPVNRNTQNVLADNTGLKDPDSDAMLKSVRIILDSKIDYEFRTTITKELLSFEDVIDIARMIPEAGKFFIQSFRPCESIPFPNLSSYSDSELNELLFRLKQILPVSELR